MRKTLARMMAAALLCQTASPARGANAEVGAEEAFFTDIPVVVEIASMFKESDLHTGATVEQFTPKEWNMRGDRNFYEVISHAPSTKPVRDWHSHLLFMRGFATSTSVRGFAMNLDGIPMNGYAGQTAIYFMPDFDLALLNRVETIRGPASYLYGSDAFHGVIALKTLKDPVDTLAVKSVYGTHEDSGGSVLLNKTLGGKLRLTGGAAYRNRGNLGLDTITNGPPANRRIRQVGEDYNNASGFFKLATAGEGSVSAGAGYYFNAHRMNCMTRFAFTGSAASRPCADDDSQFDAVRANVDVKLPAGMALETSAYYVNAWFDWYDNANMSVTGLTPYVAPTGQKRRHTFFRDVHWGEKVVLKQEEGFLRTQWALGLEHARFVVPNARRYHYSETTGGLTSVRTAYDTNPSTALDESFFRSESREAQSVFLNLKTTLGSDRFHVLWGGRYDGYSDVGGEASPRLGLIFNPTDRSAVKLLYGHAFRAPATLEKFGLARDNLVGNPQIQPESIDTYEVVFMRQTLGWKTELVGFHSLWKDGISYKTIGGIAQYTNQGRAETNGGEWKNYFRRGDFSLDLNLSCARSRNLGGPTAGDPGDVVAYYPQWMLNSTVSYDFPDDQLKLAMTNTAHYRMTNIPFSYGLANRRKFKDFWRTDVTVAKGLGRHWNVTLDVRNVLNRRNQKQEPTAEYQQLDPGVAGWVTLGWYLGG